MSKAKRKLSVVGNDTEAHKAFSGKKFSTHHLVSMKPLTSPQEHFVRSYYQDIPVIFQLGSAGTGKTLMSMYCALGDVLDKGTVYEKLIIVRSAVQTRDMGFMPGDETEKNEQYTLPYQSICDEILTFKSNNYQNLEAKGLVDFRTTSFLRGLSFENSIILVDEAQSMTYHELVTIISRCSVNTRIIFCGDTRQNDLLKKKNDQSGLADFLRVINEMSSSYSEVIMYGPEDIVRSGLVREFLLAEERIDLE